MNFLLYNEFGISCFIGLKSIFSLPPPSNIPIFKNRNPAHRRKKLHDVFKNFNKNFRMLFLLLLAFTAGCLFTGFLIFGQRFTAIGKLDQRYDNQHARAAEIIGQLEGELERERNLNRRLREHNSRARELTEGASLSAERNVRNLQDAVSLIGEIRSKLKVLADFYHNSDTGDSSP